MTSTSCASPATSRPQDDVRLQRIHDEVERGFDALRDIDDGVSVFGSARVPEGHRWYELCRETGACLAGHGFSVITGGGPGLMEAANRGAAEAGGLSVGLNIELPHRAAPQPLRQPQPQLPLLLRPQADVRPLRPRLRHLPRRLRHPRRDVREPDPDPDRPDPALPHDPRRLRPLAAPARLARHHRGRRPDRPRRPAPPGHRRHPRRSLRPRAPRQRAAERAGLSGLASARADGPRRSPARDRRRPRQPRRTGSRQRPPRRPARGPPGPGRSASRRRLRTGAGRR